jgi:hypothetical protein
LSSNKKSSTNSDAKIKEDILLLFISFENMKYFQVSIPWNYIRISLFSLIESWNNLLKLSLFGWSLEFKSIIITWIL